MPNSNEDNGPPDPKSHTITDQKKQFCPRVRQWFCWAALKLKEFDGLITAVATVFLALITALLGVIAYHTDETLNDTLKANKASERAFIYMQPTAVTMNVIGTTSFEWIVRVQIGNSGTTSTQQMRYVLGCTDDSRKILHESEIVTAATSHIIGPKVVDGSLEGCIKADTEVDKLVQEQEKVVYVFGEAIYRDVFQTESVDTTKFIKGKNHITRFCVQMKKFGKQYDSVRRTSIVDVHASHCASRYNCADEQCEQN